LVALREAQSAGVQVVGSDLKISLALQSVDGALVKLLPELRIFDFEESDISGQISYSLSQIYNVVLGKPKLILKPVYVPATERSIIFPLINSIAWNLAERLSIILPEGFIGSVTIVAPPVKVIAIRPVIASFLSC
jgi:hypothetical protein